MRLAEMSPSVGYTRENGVVFIDALGAKLVLPPSVVATYSDVHEVMVKHFRGKFGEVRVAKQGYCLASEQDGTVVRPEDWDPYKMVEKGEVLVMNMLIERAWVESVKDTCPRCGRTKLGTYQDGGWLVCRRCNTRFTYSPAPDRVDQYPPYDDNKIGSFKHMRKVFVQMVRSPTKVIGSKLADMRPPVTQATYLLTYGDPTLNDAPSLCEQSSSSSQYSGCCRPQFVSPSTTPHAFWDAHLFDFSFHSFKYVCFPGSNDSKIADATVPVSLAMGKSRSFEVRVRLLIRLRRNQQNLEKSQDLKK
ncbi:hypothetical protein NMY22_g5505 [Coprinellus aureogranulatus]|nr:hypothetical protein NMY22_g5505 [Coprinellus aureogranulatus]